jgi:hypothetical protein
MALRIGFEKRKRLQRICGLVANSISARPKVDDMTRSKNLYNPAASTKRPPEVQIECHLEGRECADEERGGEATDGFVTILQKSICGAKLLSFVSGGPRCESRKREFSDRCE